MFKFTRYIFVVLLLHLSLLCMAQPEEYPADTSVTVVEPPPEEMVSFSEIVQQQQVDGKKIPAGKINELKKEDAYWYADLERKKKEVNQEQEQTSQPGNGLFAQKWFRDLLWILILCSFIAVVIWYLASSNINLFRKESKKILDEGAEEELTDDIFSINYDKEIQKAADANNFRLAVRLWYLKTLRELASRNIINYRHERTNNDYVNSLFGGRHYNHFFRLTRNFEYTWYGGFALSAEAYEMMRNDFLQFNNSLA